MILKPGAFRLLLAILVVISHISKWEVGRIAVLIFFFLSGYWISYIWTAKFEISRVAAFYGSRFFRIFPLYILVMFASAALLGAPILWHNLTLLGVATAGKDPTGVSWSLDIELQFYLLAPFLFLLASRWPTAAGVLSLIITLAGWLVLSPLGIVSLAQYLPAFMLGLLTHTRIFRPTRRTALISLLIFSCITIALSVFSLTSVMLDKTKPNIIDHDIFGFFWMLAILPYVAHSLTLKSGKIDRHLGNLSYPLYLVHFPLLSWAFHTWGDGAEVKLLGCGVSAVAALALYALFDRPVDSIRIRLFEPAGPPATRSPSKSVPS